MKVGDEGSEGAVFCVLSRATELANVEYQRPVSTAENLIVIIEVFVHINLVSNRESQFRWQMGYRNKEQ